MGARCSISQGSSSERQLCDNMGVASPQTPAYSSINRLADLIIKKKKVKVLSTEKNSQGEVEITKKSNKIYVEAVTSMRTRRRQ